MFWDIIKTYRQAFRIFIRKRTKHVPIEEAEEKRLFWSKMYMFSTFLVLVTCTGSFYMKNVNFGYRQDISKDHAILEKVVRPSKESSVAVFKGFTKVNEYTYVPPEDSTGSVTEKSNSTT